MPKKLGIFVTPQDRINGEKKAKSKESEQKRKWLPQYKKKKSQEGAREIVFFAGYKRGASKLYSRLYVGAGSRKISESATKAGKENFLSSNFSSISQLF